MTPNGYRAKHRNQILLVTTGILTLAEYAFFEVLIDNMVFAPKNPHFKCVVVNVKVLKQLLGYSSEVSIYNKLEKLVELELLIPRSKNVYEIFNAFRYLSGKECQGLASEYQAQEKDQKTEFILQNIVPFSQKIVQKIQKFEEKQGPSLKRKTTLYSSYPEAIPLSQPPKTVKGEAPVEYDLVPWEPQPIAFYEERNQRLTEEERRSLPSPEDQAWICWSLFHNREKIEEYQRRYNETHKQDEILHLLPQEHRLRGSTNPLASRPETGT